MGLYLDHEVSDASVEHGVLVVAALGEHQEVLAGARGHVAVQLQVEVPEISVQLHISLLLGIPLYAHQGASVLGLHIDRCGCERPGGRTCRRMQYVSLSVTVPTPVCTCRGMQEM